MMGSYQRFMAEKSMTNLRKKREKEEAERARGKTLTVRCPKCEAVAQSMALSINGIYEYFKCDRTSCRYSFPVRFPVRVKPDKEVN